MRFQFLGFLCEFNDNSLKRDADENFLSENVKAHTAVVVGEELNREKKERIRRLVAQQG